MSSVVLGQTVVYNANGKQKVGLVVGTHESVNPDTSVEQPLPDHAHLVVFSPTGSVYFRQNVPVFDGDVPEVEGESPLFEKFATPVAV
jgi:hypothetical protein